jgi:hypothetical protein
MAVKIVTANIEIALSALLLQMEQGRGWNRQKYSAAHHLSPIPRWLTKMWQKK